MFRGLKNRERLSDILRLRPTLTTRRGQTESNRLVRQYSGWSVVRAVLQSAWLGCGRQFDRLPRISAINIIDGFYTCYMPYVNWQIPLRSLMALGFASAARPIWVGPEVAARWIARNVGACGRDVGTWWPLLRRPGLRPTAPFERGGMSLPSRDDSLLPDCAEDTMSLFAGRPRDGSTLINMPPGTVYLSCALRFRIPIPGSHCIG